MIRIYSLSRSAAFPTRASGLAKLVKNQERNGRKQWQIVRWQSTGSQSSSGGGALKVIVVATGVTTLGLGSIVAYAHYDPSFRKSLEGSVPYSHEVLGFLLGPIEKQPVPTPVAPPKVIRPPTVEEIKRAKEAGMAKKSVDTPPPAPVSAPPPPVEPPPPPPVEKPKPVEPPKKVEKPSLNIDAVKKKDEARNKVVSDKLSDLQKKLITASDAAVAAQRKAADAMKAHVEKVYKAIEDPNEDADPAVWVDANKAAASKTETLKDAVAKAAAVRTVAATIKKSIEDARSSKATENNPSLIPTEEKVAKTLEQLENGEGLVKQLEGEQKIIQEYKDAVFDARQKLQAEVSSISPDVKVGELSSRLTEEELNQLLLHAHRKAIHLQKMLAKQQTVDQVQLKRVVDKQREEDYKHVEGRLRLEVDQVHRDMELKFQKKLEASKEQLERELQQQLKRQAAAFSEHEKDIIAAQEAELNRIWEEKLREALYNEQTGFRAKIGQATARVRGINEALRARADLEKQSQKALEIWLASQALSESVRLGPTEAHGWENKCCSIKKEIATVKGLTESSGDLPKAIVASIPPAAVERGVFTRDALKERWNNVSRTCRKLALVGEEGGSMWRRFISVLQGFLYVSNFVAPPVEERSNQAIEVDKLNTYEILDRVRYCLDSDDLEQAVRYLNLLSGAARLAASDWMLEARLHLETAQAAEALLTYAAKMSSQSLLR